MVSKSFTCFLGPSLAVKICLLNFSDYVDFYLNCAEMAGFRVLTKFCFDLIQPVKFSTLKPGRFQADSNEMYNSGNYRFFFFVIIAFSFF